MSIDRYNQRSYWLKRCNGKLAISECPFASRSLTDRSPILWTYIMHGGMGPCEAWSGWWSFYPEPLALAGYLRHVLIPCLHEPVLAHYGKRPEPGSPLMTLDEMLELTGDDDDNIKEFIEEIDSVFGKGDSTVLGGIERALGHVNYSGGSWGQDGFELHSIVSAGQVVLERNQESCPDDVEREEIMGCSDEEWIEICESVTSNSTSKEHFLETLETNALH